MRKRAFFAAAGLAAAVLGAATSPSFGNPWNDFVCGAGIKKNCRYEPPENPNAIRHDLSKPIKQGKTKAQLADEAREKALSRERKEALKKLNALGGGPEKPVSTKFGAITNAATRAANSSAAIVEKPRIVGVVTGKGLNGSSGTFRNGDWTTPRNGNNTGMKTLTATTTNKPLYQPVSSLGVKRSTPEPVAPKPAGLSNIMSNTRR
jgi:hypothetical protein